MKSKLWCEGGAAMLLMLGCGSKVVIGESGGSGGASPLSYGNGGVLGGSAQIGNAGAVGDDASHGGDAFTTGAGGDADEGSESGGWEAGAANGGSKATGSPIVIAEIPADTAPQAESNKVDLLFAIDGSFSMANKQALLAEAVPRLVKRLINPACVEASGDFVSQPANADAPCPAGSAREIAPVRDLHIGVISSSLGSHGGAPSSVCSEAGKDDHAHLMPHVRSGLASYNHEGFLKWDPDARATPPGDSDPNALTDELKAHITAVGEGGCGFEAQLESVYRFLVDPAPPAEIGFAAPGPWLGVSVKLGTDQALLAQRAAFLRPDSAVAVVIFSDENDCSIVDEGYGHLVTRRQRMYRSTSQCLTDPNDACCQSCAEGVRNAGCQPFAEDSECRSGTVFSNPADDSTNLRCWDQKRRFGLDLLYPIERYVGAFADAEVPNRDHVLVANPLFHRGSRHRPRSLFSLSFIGGVPWQDVATPASLDGNDLTYMTAAELAANERWPVIAGNVTQFVAPTDPFMRESNSPRSGINPSTGQSIVPSTSTDPRANEINGHEMSNSDSLQFACTFELPEPVDCAAKDPGTTGCDCYEGSIAAASPACNPPGGGAPSTTQYFAGAYPGLRQLAVAHQLGRRSAVASICARNTQDDTRSDFGYAPAMSGILTRVNATLVKP